MSNAFALIRTDLNKNNRIYNVAKHIRLWFWGVYSFHVHLLLLWFILRDFRRNIWDKRNETKVERTMSNTDSLGCMWDWLRWQVEKKERLLEKKEEGQMEGGIDFVRGGKERKKAWRLKMQGSMLRDRRRREDEEKQIEEWESGKKWETKECVRD